MPLSVIEHQARFISGYRRFHSDIMRKASVPYPSFGVLSFFHKFSLNHNDHYGKKRTITTNIYYIVHSKGLCCRYSAFRSLYFFPDLVNSVSSPVFAVMLHQQIDVHRAQHCKDVNFIESKRKQSYVFRQLC